MEAKQILRSLGKSLMEKHREEQLPAAEMEGKKFNTRENMAAITSIER